VFGQRSWWNAKPLGEWTVEVIAFPAAASKPEPPREVFLDIHVSGLTKAV
jgi:hypothetical protein